LYLSAFSTHGGIEKFNRAFMHALVKVSPSVSFFSLYDKKGDIQEQYASKRKFQFIGLKFSYLKLFLMGIRLLFSPKQKVMFGHINFAPFALWVKRIRPQHQMILMAHGIDVWQGLTSSKLTFLDKVDEIWAVSNYTKSRLLAQNSAWESKIKVFPNTLDPFFPKVEPLVKPDFLSKRYQLKTDEKVILTLCRLSSAEGYKGYDRVIEALPNLKCSNYKYILAGKYDETEKKRILALAANKKVSDRLILTGFLEDEEIQAHFQLADLFVMPSSNEGFGIVFIEALACGTPVIAGNQDGSVDALCKGELGELVNPNQVEEIAAAIDQLLANDELKSFEAQKERIQKVHANFGFSLFQERLKRFLKL
jgi:glycosyltransferase involved in cell wall biosynthesis